MRIGIDLGGTKIEAIAIDPSGYELLRRRILTPHDDYEGVLAAVSQLVAEVEAQVGAAGTIGIATPGAISPATGLMKNSNSVCLNGRPLEKDLQAALGRPIRMANDADCFALSEAVDGAAAGATIVFGVILGTGVGGGVAINGSMVRGPNAIAGEWGHNPLPWPTDEERPGPACYCGNLGCIETFLSGPGLERDYQSASGQACRGQDIARHAVAGDVHAETAIARYANRLARGLATIINVLDPDVIVLGGGVSNIEQLYQRVPAQWTEYVFSDHVATRLLKAKHGDSSGVRGAAWLWADSP